MTTDRRAGTAGGRRRAVIVAGHQGDTATARAHLADASGPVRAAALGALTRTGALKAADLETGLTDEDPTVRIRALELVAQLAGGGPAAPVSLLAALADPDPTVVEVAVWASGERAPPEPGAVERLVELAGTAEDALVREAAVAALGSIGDTAGLAAILAGLQDKATVRRRAVIALAPFDGPEVDEAFKRARADRDWQVRQAAEDLSGPTEPDRDAEGPPSLGSSDG